MTKDERNYLKNKRALEYARLYYVDGLTQAAIARKEGCTRANIGRYLNMIDDSWYLTQKVKVIREEARINKMLKDFETRQHSLYLKTSKIYNNESEIYKYIIETGATYMKAAEHFNVSVKYITDHMLKMKKISPEAKEKLDRVAKNNKNNRERKDNLDEPIIKRMVRHITLIDETFTNIKETAKVCKTKPQNVAYDINKALKSDDPEIREIGARAKAIVHEHCVVHQHKVLKLERK